MTTIESLAVVAQYLLATTFVLAALAKMRTWATLSRVIRRMTVYRLGEGGARIAAALLPLVELGLGIGLAAGFRLDVIATATAMLLLIFTVFVVVHLVQGNRVPCNCFGDDRAAISIGTFVRNVMLIVLAAGLAILAWTAPDMALTLTQVLALPLHELLGIVVTTISLMLVSLALSELSALSDFTSSGSSSVG